MKKLSKLLLIALCAFACVVSLAACVPDDDANDDNNPPNQSHGIYGKYTAASSSPSNYTQFEIFENDTCKLYTSGTTHTYSFEFDEDDKTFVCKVTSGVSTGLVMATGEIDGNTVTVEYRLLGSETNTVSLTFNWYGVS